MADAEVIAMKKFWKREEGSVALIVAVAFVVLIGCGALVVDLGSIANEKRSLQNAMDAASLAGAAALQGDTDGSQATAEATQYAQANGVDTSRNFKVTVDMTQKTVTVTDTRSVQFLFAQVIVGRSSGNVSAKSTAKLTTFLGANGYAIFSGSTTEDSTITGNNTTIKGNVHSNAGLSGHGVQVTGTIEAVNSVSGWTAPEAPESTQVMQMPDFSSLTKKPSTITITPENYTLYSYVTYTAGKKGQPGTYTVNESGLPDNSVLYLKGGGIYFNGSSTTLRCCVITDGNITINGSSSNTVGLCTLNGSITFDGSKQTSNGSLFAPNGDITFNGNGSKVTGAVYAQTVTDHGGGMEVDFTTDGDIGLPETHTVLVD